MRTRGRIVALGGAVFLATIVLLLVQQAADESAATESSADTTVEVSTVTDTGVSTSTTTIMAEPGPAAAAPRVMPYLLTPTRRCLRSAGFVVTRVRSTDPRLRALGDLAQRTSLEVRRDGQTTGLAFGDVELLESLLRVPEDPYRIERRRNVLLMYLPSARTQAAAVRACLRA